MSEQPFTAFGKPVTSMTAPEIIVERILDALATGDLKAGDKLPDEAQLAKSFGVARMTLRTALDILRDLALVTTARGRFGGTFVADDIRDRLRSMALQTKVSAEALRSLTDWRRAVSGEACFLAASRASSEQLSMIESTGQGFVDGISDLDTLRSFDARLHLLIAESTGSKHLVEQERAIQDEYSVIFASLPAVRPTVNTASMEHEPLLRALRARDGERAREEMIAHIESTYMWCCSLLRVKRLK